MQTRSRACSRPFAKACSSGRLRRRAIDRRRKPTLAANPHLKLIFGYPAEARETDGRALCAASGLSTPMRGQPCCRGFAEDGAVTDYLLRMRRVTWFAGLGGSHRTARPARSGGLLRVEALVRDVSERKRLDDQSKDIYQQILQSEKMAALGQTISGVAHELNNPLATILSWAERLSEKALDDTSQARRCRVILSEAERAARIVRNLLTFARKRQSTRAMIDLNIARHGHARAADVRADAAHCRSRPTSRPAFREVFADAHQIQQVLLNLLINAEQAMLAANGRGALTVRTRHDNDRDTAILEVADDGPGVPSDASDANLRPVLHDEGSRQRDRSRPHRRLRDRAGTWRAHPRRSDARRRSDLRGGTSASAAPDAGSKAARQTLAPMDAVRGASVLIVEDERALAAAVAEALTDAGLEVDHAGDGQEALACVRNANYDVVICDLKMPRVDGMTLYRAIAAATPALARRVIFVTGDVAGTDAERFLEESGCRWLAKPFRLVRLAARRPRNARVGTTTAGLRVLELSSVAFAIRGFCWNSRIARAHRLRGFSRRHDTGQRIAKSADCTRMKLRHSRLVDADFGADLLHRGFLVVVEPDDLLLARGQRFDGRADAIFGF